MKKRNSRVWVIASMAALAAAIGSVWAVGQRGVEAQNQPTNTALLRYPDVSGDKVVFTYGGDLWTVARSGGNARRLTANPGVEQFAKFSPDGKWIAFTGEYDGNVDVYVVPADGGDPRRLTYHPAADQVLGWTPDSKKILFRSMRDSFLPSFNKLFLIGLDGGMPEELPVPDGELTSFSPDGTKIAYNRITTEFRTWKRYRGGRHSFVSIYDLKNNSYEEVPHTLAADVFPMWHGNAIYFDSDRDGTMNLYKYDLSSKTISELTHYHDYDVKWPSLGGGDKPAIVYENGGYLYTLDLGSEKSSRLPIVVETDDLWARPHFVNVQNYITSIGLSPSGVRAVIGARGEVFTVPAKKGDIRDLTNTSGVREDGAEWSPDGKWIAYFSDKSGEYELYVRPQDGSGEERRITTDGHAFRYGPKWSPDSKKILFGEKTMKLFYVDVDDGKLVQVAQSDYDRMQNYQWSPDGKWIVYQKSGANGYGRIYLYSLDQQKSFPITDGMTNDRSPAFDLNGKYLYFLSDRNFLPALTGFELDMNFNETTGVYALTLAADTPNPFAPESDEEKVAADKPAPDQPGQGSSDAKKASDTGKEAGAANGKEIGAAKPEVKPIKVDLDGIEHRVVRVPVPPGNYVRLMAGKDRVFYMANPPSGVIGNGPPMRVLHTYDVSKREDSVVLGGVLDYGLDAKASKLIYAAMVGQVVVGIIDPKPGQKVGEGKLNLAGLEMKLDPRQEWRQIFNDAWRTERDFYYDPTMRGLNWEAIKARYEKELPYVGHRSDLNYLIGEMIAELSTSHAYVGGGDQPRAKHVGVGLLGAEYEAANGYVRFKKIYAGDNSAEDTRSPLTEPGIVVHQGDYLISVNGRPVKAGDNVYSFFENTVGKEVTLKVNDKPSENGARSYTVRPIADEMPLRYLDWIESNRRKVEEATGGRCGYVHVQDTAIIGMQDFARGFYAQTDKDALIVDERWNRGGFVPTFFVERLKRSTLSYVAPRDGRDEKVPQASVDGPKVMLINGYAGSGGDAFPYYFRQMGIGLLIGERTWGGLVGINGTPPNIDGGYVTAPEAAFWRYQDGKSHWIVENKGVSPDIEVDNRPDLMAGGHDPQLEKAIEVINDELKKNPPAHPKRPDYGPAKAVDENDAGHRR